MFCFLFLSWVRNQIRNNFDHYFQAKEDVEARINDIMMEGGKVIKMEVDYSETVAKKIPEAKVS